MKRFYGDHHQVVTCRKKNPEAFSDLFFAVWLFRDWNKSPRLNNVLVCDPLVQVASGCLQLWGFTQHRLSNENKEGADGGKRQGKCTADGGGESLDTEARREAAGKGKEGKGTEAESCQPSLLKVGCRAGKRNIWLQAINTARRAHYQGNAEFCCKGNQLSKTAINGFPWGQTITTGQIGKTTLGICSLHLGLRVILMILRSKW